MTRASRLSLTVAIGVPLIWIYTARLGDAPIYLHHDEVLVARNAHAIATTGRDPAGNRLPLYFHIEGNLWQTPISIYLTALFFKILPVTETTIRLPSVVVGLSTIFLMYFVARHLFGRELPAWIAALLLALTPAMFIHSRLGFDHHYPALFVTLWLLGLILFLERSRLQTLFAATLALGIGVYSYLASLVMMPVFFLLTCAQIFERHRRSPRVYLAAGAGFALPLLLLGAWLATHPYQYAQNVRMYQLYDSSKLNPLQGIRELVSYTSLTERASVYYMYFDPSFLFFGGDTSTVHSTRQAGVFLFPVAVFLAIGVYRIIRGRGRSIHVLLLAGLLLSPLAGAIVAERYRISRALVMLPFAVLIATFGVEQCLQARHRAWRFAAIVLLAAAPLQFVGFYRDYMGEYRSRSAGWFEGNIRGAVEDVIGREPAETPRPLYLSTDIGWIDAYFAVYAIKHNRPDLIEKAELFDPKTFDLTRMPAGSFIVSRYGPQQQAMFAPVRGFRTLRLLKEPNDSVSFAVFEKGS